MIDKQALETMIRERLAGTDYELITLKVSAENDILVEVDRLAGVDVDFCAELNRFLVEKIENGGADAENYSLEVGSVSLTDPFKTKMQYEKNLGHDVEVAFSKEVARADGNTVIKATPASALPTNSKFAETPLNAGEKLVKYKGQLVSVDEETFSVDVEEKVKVKNENGKVKTEKQTVTHTWRYDEPKYVKYDLKF